MSPLTSRILTGFILTICFTWLYLCTPTWLISCIFALTLAYVLCIEWPQFNLQWFSLVYPIIPFLCLIWITAYCPRHILLYLFISAFSHDTGAYFIGKYCGKHKLAPSISPQKTWEGVGGGFACSLVLTLLFNMFFGPSWSLLHLCIFILIMNIGGVCGDLFESFLKRRVNIKDSGTFLPGHGGILDRFDSILINALIIVILWHSVPTLFF